VPFASLHMALLTRVLSFYSIKYCIDIGISFPAKRRGACAFNYR